LIFVLFGPGGAGKGTIAAKLVENDPRLWLSRSWSTRARRPGESDDAYRFVDRATFEEHAAAGDFFEWAEFLGNLYGTPVPRPPDGFDVLLEIDLQGALQVRSKRPDATLILLLPPNPEIQAERLRSRGDGEDHVVKRLEAGFEEEAIGRQIADAVVINDGLMQATAEVAGIVDSCRSAARSGSGAAGGTAGGEVQAPDALPDDASEGS
jgi:guanylate kinase